MVLGKFGQLVGAAVGLDKVPRDGGVIHNTFQAEATAGQGLQGGLVAVHDLRRRRVPQPGCQDVLGFGVLGREVDVHGGVVADDGDRSRVLADPAGDKVNSDGRAVPGAGRQEGAQFCGPGRDGELRYVEAFALRRLQLLAAVQGKKPGADRLELKLIEEVPPAQPHPAVVRRGRPG